MAKTLWSRRKFLLRAAQGATCGDCRARCPNGIPIAKRLADLKAVFG